MHITNLALAIALGITPQMATTVQATIHGDYGNGTERMQRLGAQYDDIQQAINKLYATTPQITPQATNTTPTPQATTPTPQATPQDTDPIPTPTPQATPQATPTWHDGLPACTYEDGSGQTSCYWDAQAMGNHQGHSYTITNGTAHYVN